MHITLLNAPCMKSVHVIPAGSAGALESRDLSTFDAILRRGDGASSAQGTASRVH